MESSAFVCMCARDYVCQAAVFSRQVILEVYASDGRMIFIQMGGFDSFLDCFLLQPPCCLILGDSANM